MKTWIIAALAALTVAGPALAQGSTYVRGYTRSDGTYVQPHYRSAPNSTTYDNWSSRGNVNPYTGRQGTQSPYRDSNSTYGSRSTSYGGYNSYDNDD